MALFNSSDKAFLNETINNGTGSNSSVGNYDVFGESEPNIQVHKSKCQ